MLDRVKIANLEICDKWKWENENILYVVSDTHMSHKKEVKTEQKKTSYDRRISSKFPLLSEVWTELAFLSIVSWSAEHRMTKKGFVSDAEICW